MFRDVNTARREALREAGYSGALPDMMKSHLTTLGYSGSISGMMKSWEVAVKESNPTVAHVEFFSAFQSNLAALVALILTSKLTLEGVSVVLGDEGTLHLTGVVVANPYSDVITFNGVVVA